jgi:peptidoglycan/xylan/chitin deacetylase (PgdA/CDA1 family)
MASKVVSKRDPMKVLITIDTEFWPKQSAEPGQIDRLLANFRRDIYGATTKGDYGLQFQIEMFNKFNLKATFFVESLCANAVGNAVLEDIVNSIQRQGHEVQLHCHSEWLPWIDPPLLHGRRGHHLKAFTLGEQIVLIGEALKNLRKAGANSVCAFRAGNFGANSDTLRALRQLNIRFDTSYDASISDCAIEWHSHGNGIFQIHEVCEVPVSRFIDYPGHFRHSQICACSFRELKTALLAAWRCGWSTFVIVSHSFELLGNRQKDPKHNQLLVRRLEKLIRFLDCYRDCFVTVGFGDLEPLGARLDTVPDIHGSVLNTAIRYIEQAAQRVL